MKNMKDFIIILIVLSVLSSLTWGCEKKDKSDSTKNNVSFISVLRQDGSIDNINLITKEIINIKPNKWSSHIARIADNLIYATNYGQKIGGKEISVISYAKVLSSIKLDYNRPFIIIPDKENRKAYVSFAPNLDMKDKGLPLAVIDTENNKVLKYIFVSGDISPGTMSKDYIILPLRGFGNGFFDKPNIILINRSTQEVSYMFKKGLEVAPVKIDLAPNGKLYILYGLKKTLEVYDMDKKSIVDTIKLTGVTTSNMVITDKGKAYISHFDIMSLEGNAITVIDTNTNKIIKELTDTGGVFGMVYRNGKVITSDYKGLRLRVLNSDTDQFEDSIGLTGSPTFID